MMTKWREPSVEDYNTFKLKAEHIDKLLDALEKRTSFLASPETAMNRAEFRELAAMGDTIIPYLMHSMIAKGAHWPHLMLLRVIIGSTPIPDEHAGMFMHQVNDWLTWYLKSPYFENTDIYYGLA